jgi:hypothetical protein
MKKNVLFIFIIIIFFTSISYAKKNELFPAYDEYLEKHSFGGPSNAELSICKILQDANLKYKIDNITLKDGTQKKLIKVNNASSIIDIEGNPYVISSSVMIIPTDDDLINLNSLVTMGATLNVFCTSSSPNESRKFLNIYNKFIGNNALSKKGLIGKCKYEMAQMNKRSSHYFFMVQFKPKNLK